jgi:calpain-15
MLHSCARRPDDDGRYRDFFFPPSDLSLGDLDIVKHKQPCCVQSCCCCNWVCTCHDPLGDATVEWKRLGEMHDLSGKVGDDDGPIQVNIYVAPFSLKSSLFPVSRRACSPPPVPPPVFFFSLSAQLFAGGIDAGDIAQGALGDCWLLAAVAATAEEHPEIIKSLFLTQEAEPCGCYRLRLYDIKHYRWRTFTIDDRIPVDAHGRPYFSKPNGDEMWVALLEKAFAKMWGSYAALEGGWASVAFEAFTGNERVDLKLDTFLGA